MSILWRNPGMIRALFGFVVGGALGFGLVVALRAISGLEIYQTEQTGYPHVVVPGDHRPAGLPGRHGLLLATGSAGPAALPRSPRTTPSTGPRSGRTTSASTPITR